MSDWKDTLCTEYEELTAEVSVPLPQAKEPVSLHFGGATELTPTMEEVVNVLLAKLPSMERTITETVFSSYQDMASQFGDEDDFPVAADAEALKPFYQLRTIYLPYEHEEGRFGLGFECDWEVEHGFGLQFRNWQIVEVGGEAEAFSFYD